jgi:RNA polymerase sigma-70 factor, ECF subfamily
MCKGRKINVFSEKDIILAKKGNEESFVRLIESCELSLYRVARGLLSNDSDCADAIQETILKSFRSIRKLKQPKYFKTWITRILINECHNILRKKQTVVPVEDIEYYLSDRFLGDPAQSISEAIGELDEKHRAPVILYYYEDFSVKEIAELLEISTGTVKSRLNRARAKLSVYLSEERGIGNA